MTDIYNYHSDDVDNENSIVLVRNMHQQIIQSNRSTVKTLAFINKLNNST